MSTKLNSTPTLTALALAALLAAGCASQSTSDNASADNAAAGQSDVVSQTNPLDQPAEGTTAVMLPSAQTAQTAPYSDATTATAPADSTMASTTTDPAAPAMVDNSSTMAAPNPAPMTNDTNRWPPATTTTTTMDNSAYTSDQPLPPRADRN